MYVHRPGKLRSALWSGGELIGQPQLGRCIDGSRDDVGAAHLD
jgi:hypothetical protein